ncbi:hypothetical protein KA005_13755 [bacterium]|nr:hypothetical protein [bacterium]
MNSPVKIETKRLEEDGSPLELIVKKQPEVKCRHCGYDGSEPGSRRPVAIDNLGVAKLTCSRCGKETVIK